MSSKTKLKLIENICELTQFQKRYLNEYLHGSAEALFQMNLRFEFEGTVDVEIFARCWLHVIEQYPVLRSGYYHDDSVKPLQITYKEVTFSVEVLDWVNVSKSKQEKDFNELIENDQKKDFQLNCPPIMRLTLIITGKNSFVIWWRFPQLIMDGWNIPLIINSFIQYYRTYYVDKKRPQIIKDYLYQDYVSYLRNRDKSNEKSFWQKYLADFSFDHHLPARNLLSGTEHKIRYSRLDIAIQELYAPINSLARENEITVNAFFQSIYLLVIAKFLHYKKTDILLGSIVSDRPLVLRDIHYRVGPYINLIPIRGKAKDEISFCDFMHELHLSMLDALQYSSTSEDNIRQWCGIPDEYQLFDSIVVFENMPVDAVDFNGLDFALIGYNFENRPGKPLNLFIWPGEKMVLKMVYDITYFKESDIANLLNAVKSAIMITIQNPGITIAELSDNIKVSVH